MDDSRQRFELLRVRYAASFAEKRRALDDAWRAFLARPGDPAVRSELQQQAHRLSGSAPAYGYEALGALARTADSLMQAWPAASSTSGADEPAQLAAPVRSLLDELERLGAAAVAPESRLPESLRVLLLDGGRNDATLRAMVAHLEANACMVRRESEADRLWEALLIWPCHALVLDYGLPGKRLGETVAMLRSEPRFARIALVCSSARRDVDALRAAIDAGCDAALARTEGAAPLLAAMRDCVARPDRSGIRFG